MSLRAAALCLCVLTPQAPPLFSVNRDVTPPRLSADRPAVGAAFALREVGKALSWRVDFATKQLEEDLSNVSLDLSFDDQAARTVAHLIAAAGGADVVFDDRSSPSGPKTVLHVVQAPSAEAESGRQRLRRWAMKWYQAFLSDDMKTEPVVGEKAMEVRMHLGHMLLQQGESREAIEYFQQVHDEDESHPYVPLALLRLAQCHHDLGDFEKAETWARKVSKMHPSRSETAAATVLLGRNLVKQHRYDECVATMRASILPLASTPEIIDILLIMAEAHLHRERPDYVLEQMRMLAESKSFRDLNRSQWLDYHFLRGFGAEGTAVYPEAIEMLEIFLGTGDADSRRGQALVLLGRSYLATRKFVQARAAALQALSYQSMMDRFWRKEARILQARAALSLGQKDDAFEDLEREVRRDPVRTPELITFLIEAFIADNRFQKAIATSDLLTATPGKWGDQARYLKILAMWKRRPRLELMPSFIKQAIAIVPQIQDEDIQRKATEIIGQAYGALGDWERAVDAYRGVLQ